MPGVCRNRNALPLTWTWCHQSVHVRAPFVLETPSQTHVIYDDECVGDGGCGDGGWELGHGGTSIGKRYARTDELGVPLAITMDSTTSVTLRERDSNQQIRVSIEEVASVVKEVTNGLNTWNDVLWKYPTHSSAASED
ncbi:hypothetical protein RHGRI_011768 [Rhododendron griersonianum]|uniref:Anticodon-binding domain-containing protein n=1 Tax=Rhododendron griersonianum TaxID=479676 RepID=A0AAV6KP78_9ERIC|nr:hypothetical protein RHGRI_011768 [Rhododendron griersonianum]